jgi:hypothetical protein
MKQVPDNPGEYASIRREGQQQGYDAAPFASSRFRKKGRQIEAALPGLLQRQV